MSQPAVQSNPYAAPKAAVQDADGPGGPAPALWNPNAAANWSLLFTPAFGAYLHMLNWREIGQPERASASKVWFVVSLALLAISLLIGLLASDERGAGGGGRGIALIFLIVWYFASARGQARYVKERWGSDYPRRGWGKPLLIAIAAYAAFIALAFAAGLMLAGALRSVR
jgi:hypothetical protein